MGNALPQKLNCRHVVLHAGRDRLGLHTAVCTLSLSGPAWTTGCPQTSFWGTLTPLIMPGALAVPHGSCCELSCLVGLAGQAQAGSC